MKQSLYSLVVGALLILASSVYPQSLSTSEKRQCSIDGIYCVTLPPMIEIGGGGPLESGYFDGFGSSYTTRWRGAGLFILTGYLNFKKSNDPVPASERVALFKEATARFRRLMANETGTEKITERQSRVKGITVTDLVVQSPGGKMVSRLASTEKGIAVLRTTFSAEARASAMKFLDSLETPDLKLIVDEKLRAATPEDLPACDAETLTVSDLEQNHLKGKVRSITVEREEMKDGKATRELRGVQEYDQKGRLVKAIVYRAAFRPEYVYVYGCIDGKRVTNIGDVSYENRFTAYGPSRPGAKPRDKRYTSHFELNLDEKGRVNEKLIFGNDSILHTSVKYIYGENKVETVTTNDEGKERSRNVLTFDANGKMVSLVESMYGSSNKKIEWRYTYKFDVFDKQGNWVKSSGIYEYFEDGNPGTTFTYTEYRTITYYK